MSYKKDEPVILPKDVLIGNPEAPLTLMQFGDYECESALQGYLVVREVLQILPGVVNFNYRHFPQQKFHLRAHKAAEAAIAAAQAGMFPQMHEMLVKNPRNLGMASLSLYARELGIGGIEFLESLVSGKYGQYVQGDLDTAIKMGAKAAPSFFINGARMEGRLTVKNTCEQLIARLRKVRAITRSNASKLHSIL